MSPKRRGLGSSDLEDDKGGGGAAGGGGEGGGGGEEDDEERPGEEGGDDEGGGGGRGRGKREGKKDDAARRREEAERKRVAAKEKIKEALYRGDLAVVQTAWSEAVGAGEPPGDLADPTKLDLKEYIGTGLSKLIAGNEFDKARNFLDFLKLKKIPFDLATIKDHEVIHDKLRDLILAGSAAEAKAIVKFFKDGEVDLDLEGVKTELGKKRDALLEKGKEKAEEAVALEKAAEDAGVPLPPPKEGVRPDIIEKRIAELKGKIRFGDAAELMDPEKVKERLRGLLGKVTHQLMTGQSLLRATNSQERGREAALLQEMTNELEGVLQGLTPDERLQKAQEIYYAAKSWLLGRASEEEQPKFLGRLLRPLTGFGKVAKGVAMAGAGIASVIFTGPYGIVITGGLRQLDLMANRKMNEVLANRFRAKKKEDAAFLGELETVTARLVATEAQRAMAPDAELETALAGATDPADAIQRRTWHYFEKTKTALNADEKTRDQLNEDEKNGIAQRLAVYYALDDETEERRREAEARQPTAWQKFCSQIMDVDRYVAGSTPAEQWHTGAAALAVGMTLAFTARTGRVARSLVAAYGGWKIGGALYEMGGRERKDPVLGAKWHVRQANETLDKLKAAQTAKNWATYATLAVELKTRLADLKGALEHLPKGAKAAYEECSRGFQEGEKKYLGLREMEMEFAMAEFANRQEQYLTVRKGKTEAQAATIAVEQAMAAAGEVKISEIEQARAVERERDTLTSKRVAVRLVGAAAIGTLAYFSSELAAEAKERLAQWLPSLGETPKPSGVPRPIEEAVRMEPREALEGVPPVETAKTPEDLLADFRSQHGILDKQGFDIKYEGGKMMVAVELGREGKFDYLQQALRRLMTQEYDFKPGQGTMTAMDAGRVENSVSNLRLLLLGRDVAGMDADTVREFASYDPKTHVLQITDYEKFAQFTDERLLTHSQEIIKPGSGALAYVDNTSHAKWDAMMEHRAGEPDIGHKIAVEDFNNDPLVVRAEQNLFFHAYENNIGIAASEVVPIDEDSGYAIISDGQYQVEFENGVVTNVIDISSDTGVIPAETISLQDPEAGNSIQSTIHSYEQGRAGGGGVERVTLSQPASEDFHRLLHKPTGIGGLLDLVSEGRTLWLGQLSFEEYFLHNQTNMAPNVFVNLYKIDGAETNLEQWGNPAAIHALAEYMNTHPDTDTPTVGDYIVEHLEELKFLKPIEVAEAAK